MFQKLIVAFGLGVLLTGGVVYVAMKNRTPEPAPVPVSVAVPAPAPAAIEPAPPPAPEPAAPQPEPVKPKPVIKQAKRHAEKPAPVTVARNELPPAPEPARTVPPAPPVVTNPDPIPEARPVAVKAPEPKPEPRKPHSVTVPAGTMITVRLREELSTKNSQDGQNFTATLDQPLVVDGFVIAERGSSQRGRIVELDQSGRVKGRAALAVELTELTTADGQKIALKTDSFRKEAESGVKGDMAKAGVAAGIGAAIGAIAGGGKGAAIGAGIGGAAGAGGVLATRGKEAKLPSETRITFRLKEPLTLTEKLDD
ncbi:hypothetical protein [uncultured Paludibaculum sp.]|uniref:hypothetical protein n=1 Tax=uncultured Paludibaculum sp. TaxID=1765020 RepID=UPI002AABC4F5|nr:hypothetical protein [uncultured Paludibaculum sp.]